MGRRWQARAVVAVVMSVGLATGIPVPPGHIGPYVATMPPPPPVLRLNREPRERKIVHTVDTASVNAILKVCELLVV